MSIFTNAERQQFIEQGFVVVKEAFPRQTAADLVEQFWQAAPFDRFDRATWKERITVIERAFVPSDGTKLWGERPLAALDELNGAGRYHVPATSGWPVFNLPGFASAPWSPPAPEEFHIDGMHFHHHLTSKEQGLVGLLLFTDVEPEGGGTAVMPGSHKVTAQILREAEPEGLDLHELAKRVGERVGNLTVIEVTGNAGDILMMHPHLYHASSGNCSDRVRIASNFCVSLKEAMNLNRPDGNYSLVEQAII